MTTATPQARNAQRLLLACGGPGAVAHDAFEALRPVRLAGEILDGVLSDQAVRKPSLGARVQAVHAAR